MAGRRLGDFSRHAITISSRASGTGRPDTAEGRSGGVRTWSRTMAMGSPVKTVRPVSIQKPTQPRE